MQLSSKILTSALMVQLQKKEKLQELGYLKVACLSHIRYHGVLLWNEIAVDLFSVAMWFGTCSCLAVEMPTRSLLRPLFVAKTTWFGIPAIKCVMAMPYRWDLGCYKSPCGVFGHLFQRECASWKVWVS